MSNDSYKERYENNGQYHPKSNICIEQQLGHYDFAGLQTSSCLMTQHVTHVHIQVHVHITEIYGTYAHTKLHNIYSHCKLSDAKILNAKFVRETGLESSSTRTSEMSIELLGRDGEHACSPIIPGQLFSCQRGTHFCNYEHSRSDSFALPLQLKLSQVIEIRENITHICTFLISLEYLFSCSLDSL